MNSLTIVTQYFYPDVATTGQLLTELSIALSEDGFSVHVVTAQPSYQKKDTLASEQYRGVTIRRLWSTRINKNLFVGKVLNSLSFFFSTLVHLFFRKGTGPLLIVSNPPFLPFIGTLLSRLSGVPYIFLVHDVYPDIAVRLGYVKHGGIIEKLYNIVNGIILKNASAIIVLSSSMAANIRTKLKVLGKGDLADRISIIHNWADGGFIAPVEKRNNEFLKHHGLEGKFIVQYSGNMGLFHELEMLVEVARMLNDDTIFMMIGDGGKKWKLLQMVAQYQLSNVMFLPYQPVETLPQSLTAASVSIVSLEENIEGLAMPSKLYTLLACGNPIIAICDEHSDLSNIILSAECGFVVRHHDNEMLHRCIMKLKTDGALCETMGRNARKYFEQHFTLEIAVKQYRSIIESVA